MTCGIYCIKKTINEKFYIGSSKQIESRWMRHLKDLQCGKHHNLKLQRAFTKYKENAFVFEIIEHVAENSLLEREQYYLDMLQPYNSGYNIGQHATGGDNLTSHPNREEIIRRITEGTRKRLAERTPEEIETYRQKMMGENNPNYGHKWSDELREKVSKIVKPRFTPEKRKELSIKLSNRWKDESFRKIMIDNMCGKTHDRNGKTNGRSGEYNPFYGKTHTDKTKNMLRNKSKLRYKKMSLEEKQKIIPHMKDIIIDDILYHSLSEASRSLSIPISTILWRLKSLNPKFNNYNYA